MANKSYQQGIIKRYYEQHDTIQSNKLSELVSELWLTQSQSKLTKLWGKAQAALMRMGVEPSQAADIVAKRDLEQLAKLVGQLDASGAIKKTDSQPGKPQTPNKPDLPKAIGAQSVADGRTISQMRSDKASTGGYDSLEEDNLKRALKAFRRKLKTTRRDDESKLGSRCVTYGRSSNIVAITPPAQFPMAVWNQLAETGRLKKSGSGTFELP